MLLATNGSGAVKLSYGASSADIATAEATVDVLVAPVSTSSSIEGRIAGRYLTTSGVGPTDTVSVLFAPPNSSLPPMLIQRFNMFGGYFNVFGFTDVPFTYRLGDGSSLFPAPARLEPIAANPLHPTTASTSMVYVPAAHRPPPNAGDAPVARVFLVGYFGPGAAATNQVCYGQSAGDISGAFLDLALSTPIPWTFSPTPLATLLNQSAGVLAGGSGLTCSGTSLTDYLQISRDTLANGDGAVPFRGPYAAGATGNYLTFANVTGSLSVSWTYAPGVFNGPRAITGSQVFYLPSPSAGSNFKNSDHGFDCGRLATAGFTPVAPVIGAGATSVVISGLSTSSNAEIIVCPYRQDAAGVTYFNDGVDGNPFGIVAVGPYTGAPPYHLMLTASSTAPGVVVTPLDSIPHNAVSNIFLQVVDQQNRAVAVGGGVSMTLQTGYSPITFNGSSDTASVTFDANGVAGFSLYVGNNELVTNVSASYNSGIARVPPTSTLILPVGPWVGEPTHLFVHTMMAPSPTYANQCVPVEYSLGDGVTGVLQPSAVNVTLTPSATSGSFYTAPDCVGAPLTSATIPAGKVMSYLYFKASSTGSVTLSVSAATANASSVPIVIYSPGSLYLN